MTMMRRNHVLLLTGLGLSLLSGCQTWVPEAGLTLPSEHYLHYNPQYFPPSEPYPLPKELNSLEEAQRQYNDSQRQLGQ
jgi:hypothetical protein